MGENLVIVESPAKAKTIEKFLGEGFTVKSSRGHIRDLSKKNLGIDIAGGFIPQYEISADKKKIVAELSAEAKKADMVWLASDEDREGEAIAWHLFETLKLKKEKTRRIVFHEITENAIKNAIKTPRDIDSNLVMAQQARRVLDRLVGFELSPVLWKKVQPKLSAGRVQSVAVRLIVDKEREIAAFKAQQYFRVEATFIPEGSKKAVKGVLDRKFATEDEAMAFLEKCRETLFSIKKIEKKETVRTPAAPFTTSTLQQEASRKLGLSVNQTMSVAQKLYEEGHITYMRTDSTNLSSLAINTARNTIEKLYGESYSKVRNYHTKVKGAQEAHEAIRPTYIGETELSKGTPVEKRLYNLIWKRTVACQMADAIVEKTDVTVAGDNIEEKFTIQGEQILFDGFLKLYIEGRDDEEDDTQSGLLPKMAEGQKMYRNEIAATEKRTSGPSRFSEAMLIKKLEELGIGRPSTYGPTIQTILTRGYVIKGDKSGSIREYAELVLNGDGISRTVKSENWGAEKGRIYPENIGIVVNDYLSKHFSDILDYGFTAKVEDSFDEVANGKMVWNKLISDFYGPFHKNVELTIGEVEHTNGERVIGTDPETGKTVIARIGKYGPLVQRGANDDPEKQFVSMNKGQLIESITLEEALKLLQLPRKVGHYNGEEIIAAEGRFGPYVKVGKTFVSLGKTHSPYTVTEEEAVTLIEEHFRKESNKTIATFDGSGIQVLNGRYGPYIKYGKENFRIPKGTDPSTLDEAACLAIIEKEENKTSSKRKK